MRPGRAVASFDSATGMLRALSRYLAGTDVPSIGQSPRALEPALAALLGGVNRLPVRVTEKLYAMSGITEAVSRTSLSQVNSDDLASWVVEHYPKRQYPVIFLGSSNGALVHLAAALDAPWLPQTVLIPVRRRHVDRDDPQAELRSGLAPGRALLDANPQLGLHHMHDPNQDRLMVAGMSYFRVKWRSLPSAYRRFIRDHLAPGGTVVTVECGLTWPVTKVGDRHVFQFGALGGASRDEYFRGGPRVSDFLERYGASRRAWAPPHTDAERPEAEWGFESSLLDELTEFASAEDFSLRRMEFDHPEALSPVVADIYREWYAREGFATGRLLGESFLLLEPWWTLRTGSVPFWASFNTQESLGGLDAYLDEVAPYDEIRLMLFSHGTESIGLASVEEWRRVAERAGKIGSLLGVDANAYPRDFASLARAHRGLTRIRHLQPMPPRLLLPEVEPRLRDHAGITWST